MTLVRRPNGHRAPRLARALERCNVIVRDVPQREAPPCGTDQGVAAGRRGKPLGKQKLLLRRHELRGIQLEQWISCLNEAAGFVDVELFHPATDACVHDAECSFVGNYHCDGPDGTLEGSISCHGERHASKRRLPWSDPDRRAVVHRHPGHSFLLHAGHRAIAPCIPLPTRTAGGEQS